MNMLNSSPNINSIDSTDPQMLARMLQSTPSFPNLQSGDPPQQMVGAQQQNYTKQVINAIYAEMLQVLGNKILDLDPKSKAIQTYANAVSMLAKANEPAQQGIPAETTLQLEQMKLAHDQHIKEQELAMKQQAHQQDMQMKQEQHQHDLQIKTAQLQLQAQNQAHQQNLQEENQTHQQEQTEQQADASQQLQQQKLSMDHEIKKEQAAQRPNPQG